MSVIKNVNSRTLSKNVRKMVKKGSMVYTDQWKGYDTLVTSGYKREAANHSKFFSEGDVRTNGIEGFWAYAKEKLAKHHGMSKDNFVYYIKEMEWRYNNRGKDLDLIMLDSLLERSKVRRRLS